MKLFIIVITSNIIITGRWKINSYVRNSHINFIIIYSTHKAWLGNRNISIVNKKTKLHAHSAVLYVYAVAVTYFRTLPRKRFSAVPLIPPSNAKIKKRQGKECLGKSDYEICIVIQIYWPNYVSCWSNVHTNWIKVYMFASKTDE